MPKPPVDPDSFDKVNYIIDSWSTGCDAPWYIYIETMGPAALEAFIVLISFGWADVLRGALRPKGLGRRTSKRKGRWNRRLPAFPEVGNTIGKHLPFAEQVEDFAHWGGKTRFLWRIDNLVQAGLFWWLVVDVAEDFVFNWTSLLYEGNNCKDPELGRFSYRNLPMPTKAGNRWNLEAFGTKDYEHAPPAWGFSGGGSGPNGCTVMAAANFAPAPGWPDPGSVAIRVFDQDTGKALLQTGPEEADPSGETSIAVAGAIGPNIRFQVWTYHDVRFAKVGNGFVAAVETAS